MGVDTARVVHNEVLETSHREMICVFCSDLINPHDAVQALCGHAFCTACINRYADSGNNKCPLDKVQFKREELRNLKDSNPLVYRLLGNTDVRCENWKGGCNWIGALFDVPAHLKDCERLERHCECCKSARDELKAAKELLVGYERYVSDYKQILDGNKREKEALQQRVMQLEAQLMSVTGRSPAQPPPAPGPANPTAAASSSGASSSLSAQTHPVGAGRSERQEFSLAQHTTALPSAPPLTGTWSPKMPSLGNYPSLFGSHSTLSGPSATEPRSATPSGAAMGEADGRPRLNGAPSGSHSGDQEGPRGKSTLETRTPVSAPQLRPASSIPPRIPKQPWQGGILSMTLFGHKAEITAMAVSPEGKVLFSGDAEGNLRVWHGGGCIFKQDSFHNGCVLSLAYAADTDTLYSCGEDKAVKACPHMVKSIVAGEGQQAQQILVEEPPLMGPIPLRVCSAGSHRLVVAHSNGRVTCRENLKMAFEIREKGPSSLPLDLVANSSGTVFVSGSADHAILMHRWGVETHELRGHTAEVSSMAVGPGNTLVSLSTDGVVNEWRDGRLTGTWTGWRVAGKLAVGMDGVVYCGKEKERSIQCRQRGSLQCTLVDRQVCKDDAVVLAIGSEGILYSGERSGAIRKWQCPP